METFATRLAESIELSGYSRPEVAERAGVGTSALAKWLSGKLMPKSEQVVRLARALDVRMEWLITGTGFATPEEEVISYLEFLTRILKRPLTMDELEAAEDHFEIVVKDRDRVFQQLSIQKPARRQRETSPPPPEGPRLR